MSLSNKKIKYIKNTYRQKSIRELSLELEVSEKEIEEVLSSERSTLENTSSKSNEAVMSAHFSLILIQALLIFIAPLISMNSGWYDFANLAQGLYIQSISGFMLFIWLLDCFINRKFEIKRSNLYLPIISILLWSGLSFIWATNRSESFEIMSQWIACAIIFFVIYNMVQSSFEVSIILGAIATSMAYLIVIGLIQFFNSSFTLYNQVIPPSATFGNKNMFCDYLVIVLPVCIYFFMNGSDKSKLLIRIISGLCIVCGILLIFFSKTRAGMLSTPILGILLIMALIILGIRNNAIKDLFSKQKTILSISFISLFFIVLVSYILMAKEGDQTIEFAKRIKSIFVLPEKDKLAFADNIKDTDLHTVSDSTSIRLITWANTLKMIQDKPIQGFGLYNWQIHYGEYRKAYFNDPTYMPGLALAQVHNDYLQILADLGLVGFSLFAWFIIAQFILFKKLYFSTEEVLEIKLKSLSIILCIIGFGIVCSFSFLIVKSVPSFLLFIYAALLANLFFHSRTNKTIGPQSFKLNSSTAGKLLIPILILSCFVTRFEIIRGETDQLFKTALDSHKRQNFDVVIKVCDEILEKNPLQYKTHFILANAYMATKNYQKAEFHIEKGLKYYPNDLFALFQAGTIYIVQLKELLENEKPDLTKIDRLEEKTIYWYGKAFKIRNDFSKALNNIGFLYERKSSRLIQAGKKEEAEKALKEAESNFDQAIAQDPTYLDPILNKANILVNTGRGSEAVGFALKVVSISTENLHKKDDTLKELINSNYQKNTGKFYDAYNQQLNAKQEYLNTIPKALIVLKNEYSRSKNYEELVHVFEKEIQLYLFQIENNKNNLSTIEKEYENAKNDPENLRKGTNLNQQQELFINAKRLNEQTELELTNKIALTLIDIADAYRLLNKKDEFLWTLQKIVEMSFTKEIPEQETLARLKLNDYYLGNLNKQEIADKIPVIEENFLKATFNKNPVINKGKEDLERNFKEIKKSLKRD